MQPCIRNESELVYTENGVLSTFPTFMNCIRNIPSPKLIPSLFDPSSPMPLQLQTSIQMNNIGNVCCYYIYVGWVWERKRRMRGRKGRCEKWFSIWMSVFGNKCIHTRASCLVHLSVTPDWSQRRSSWTRFLLGLLLDGQSIRHASVLGKGLHYIMKYVNQIFCFFNCHMLLCLWRSILASEKLVFGWNAFFTIQLDPLCGCPTSSFMMVSLVPQAVELHDRSFMYGELSTTGWSLSSLLSITSFSCINTCFLCSGLKITEQGTSISINASNVIFWQRHVIVTLSQQQFSFEQFPNDVQDITIRYGSFGFDQVLLNMTFTDTPIKFVPNPTIPQRSPNFELNSEWFPVENASSSTIFFTSNPGYANGSNDWGYTDAVFIFPVERYTNGLVVRLAIPITILLVRICTHSSQQVWKCLQPDNLLVYMHVNSYPHTGHGGMFSIQFFCHVCVLYAYYLFVIYLFYLSISAYLCPISASLVGARFSQVQLSSFLMPRPGLAPPPACSSLWPLCTSSSSVTFPSWGMPPPLTPSCWWCWACSRGSS